MAGAGLRPWRSLCTCPATRSLPIAGLRWNPVPSAINPHGEGSGTGLCRYLCAVSVKHCLQCSNCRYGTDMFLLYEYLYHPFAWSVDQFLSLMAREGEST